MELPDHPLISETIGDCLHEAMDIDGLSQDTCARSKTEEIKHGRRRYACAFADGA